MQINEAWIIAPVNGTYPLKENVHVISLPEFLNLGIG